MKITIEAFKKYPFCEIFATGFAFDNENEINMTRSNLLLRWVAVKDETEDWSIYVGPANDSIEYIKDCGDKLTFERNIKNVIDCDDDVFKLYRF